MGVVRRIRLDALDASFLLGCGCGLGCPLNFSYNTFAAWIVLGLCGGAALGQTAAKVSHAEGSKPAAIVFDGKGGL